MSAVFKLQPGTSGGWADDNPILAVNEAGYKPSTGEFKIGDGETRFNALSIPNRSQIDRLQTEIDAIDGGTP